MSDSLPGSKVMCQGGGGHPLITEEPYDWVTWQWLPTVKEPRKRRSFPE